MAAALKNWLSCHRQLTRHHVPIRIWSATAFSRVLRKKKNIFVLCEINLDVTGATPAATRITNERVQRVGNVLIFVVFVQAHLATDTFYSVSSFCNARNEFAATTRAAAKHLRGKCTKIRLMVVFSVAQTSSVCDERFEGCWQSWLQITKHKRY